MVLKNKKEEKKQKERARKNGEDKEAFMDLILEKIEMKAKAMKNKEIFDYARGYRDHKIDGFADFAPFDVTNSIPMYKPFELLNMVSITEPCDNRGYKSHFYVPEFSMDYETVSKAHKKRGLLKEKDEDGKDFSRSEVFNIYTTDKLINPEKFYLFSSLFCTEVMSAAREACQENENSFDKMLEAQKSRCRKESMR